MKTKISILLISLFCLNNNILYSQNAPITIAGDYTTYETAISIPITTENFNNIGSCDLQLEYDETIVNAIAVTQAGLQGNFFNVYLGDPGKISLGWLTYPGLTLPDESIIFTIDFVQVSAGTSPLTWIDDGSSCSWYDGDINILNDLPTSSYYINGSVTFPEPIAPIIAFPDITICEGPSTVDIPLMVSAFNQIGAFTLTMQYDNTVVDYLSLTNNSEFPGLEVNNTSPGTIIIDGLSDLPDGISMADGSVLFTMHFSILGGSTEFTWIDNGESCEFLSSAPSYYVLIDEPYSAHYINGSFSELQIPSPAGIITGPEGGTVCQGESGVLFSVLPIQNADSYAWTFPNGATITSGESTSEIVVTFSNVAIGGNVSVYGINQCGNGNTSPSFPLEVNIPPAITIQPVSPDTVYAGAGIASISVTAIGTGLSFQWQEFITDWSDVSDGGVYSGTLTDILTITDPPITMNENKYRCIVSGNCEPPAISDGNAMLSVILNTGFDNPNYEIDPGNDKLKFEAFPNPFSEQITFAYTAPSKGIVLIEIINMYGENVMTLTNQVEAEGSHLLPVNTKHLKPGIYAATITFKSDKVIISNILKIISNK